MPITTATSSSEHRSMFKDLLSRRGLLLLFGVAVLFALYAVSLDSGFVLDDKNNIENNPYIRVTSLTADALSAAAFKSVLPKRPVANISFAVNYFFHNYNVRAFRLTNLLLHIATAILLYFLVFSFFQLPRVQEKYGPPGWTPALTAVLWLVHPVHTQTVNYIVQRMTILAAFFYILSFLLFIKGKTARNTSLRWMLYAGTLLVGLLGLWSKETVIMLPVFLLLFNWYFIEDPRQLFSRKTLILLLIMLVAAVILVFFYLGKDPLAHILNTFHGREFTLGQRLLTQGRVVLFYLGLILLPMPGRMNLEHDFTLSMSLADPPSTILALAAIALLLMIAIVRAKKSPLLSFCIFWYFGNLVIESSVIGLEIIFEHRVYLPSMLIILPAVLWLQKYLRRNWQLTAAFIVIFFCFSFWTYERNLVWADTVSLLADAVSKSPQKARPHLNLGIELKNEGRLDEAISHYRKALAIKPFYADAYYNLGNALSKKGDFKGAAENYFKTLALTPYDVDTHYNLGYTLAKLWDFDRAEYHYSEAIRLRPDFVQARQELSALKIYRQRLMRKKSPAQ